ncbi:hypothetical protein KAFR_0F00180 [Kazachstania africana CBS 2517]|uniref:Phosphorelay intermediate protein YPD1 n=1 Tax=Kazachstania africana (strain ATCC 22294 / BCRC 22015 / CBS 2517 / CECT 1963 / NBRC 1671 / NRRL Y-8276) TaxID=1071382 RepID=H2AW65_KAZAF|nr:hypothetical protein KAFR_0F00180 [Kazachstania africana CBS 2517]CCF58615.1 hypothetical protein KAFR_0F00180 [Kazachstania africana CBS 2517]
MIPPEVVNWSILNEIISMDEDDPGFSKSLIIQFFDQAITTFDEMEKQLTTTQNLAELDNLGHFLKGSSAALGLQRIAWVCERIQNLGRRSESTFPEKEILLSTVAESVDIDTVQDSASVAANFTGDDSAYLNAIAKALTQARVEFKLARKELCKYYGEEF